jgi:hypothetical protein
VDDDDKPGRERLIKYILRPPVAAERALVARLAALVPPPWQNQVRYSGVLAPASKWRARIAAKPPDLTDGELACGHDGPPPDGSQPTPEQPTHGKTPKGKGFRYWPWQLLKARTFGEQTTTCAHCHGELALRALVQDPHSVQRILTHFGLPTDIPRPAAARGPPYYRSRVRRLRPGDDQQDLLP